MIPIGYNRCHSRNPWRESYAMLSRRDEAAAKHLLSKFAPTFSRVVRIHECHFSRQMTTPGTDEHTFFQQRPHLLRPYAHRTAAQPWMVLRNALYVSSTAVAACSMAAAAAAMPARHAWRAWGCCLQHGGGSRTQAPPLQLPALLLLRPSPRPSQLAAWAWAPGHDGPWLDWFFFCSCMHGRGVG